MARKFTCPETSSEREAWARKQAGILSTIPTRDGRAAYAARLVRVVFAAGKAAAESSRATELRRIMEGAMRPTTGGATSLPPAMRAALDATGDALLGSCEGCEAPAVTMDPEGVHLCRPCAKACDEETTAEATARTVGDSLRRTLNDRTFETIVDASKAAKASDGKGA